MGYLNVTTEGYIKLWRKLKHSPIWRVLNPSQQIVLIHILWAANWVDRVEHLPGKGPALVTRGTFLCTLRELSLYAEVSIQTVRSAIKHMTAATLTNIESGVVVGDHEPFISTLQVARSCTLITVINYEHYQADPELSNTQTNNSPTHAPTHTPTDVYIKKDKKVKNKSAPGDKNDLLLFPPEAWRMAELHRELLLKHDPDSSCGGNRWSKQRWAKAYDKGQRTTCKAPLPWDYVEKVLTWALDDSEQWTDGRHWRDFLGTPGRFFTKWDTLRRQHLHGTQDELETDPDSSAWDWDQDKLMRQLEGAE